eukprot:4166555-Alexandrium_andersonii.AAC.1
MPVRAGTWDVSGNLSDRSWHSSAGRPSRGRGNPGSPPAGVGATVQHRRLGGEIDVKRRTSTVRVVRAGEAKL